MKLNKLKEKIETISKENPAAKDLEEHAFRLQARASEIFEIVALLDQPSIHFLNEACPELVNLAVATGRLENIGRAKEIKEVITSFGRKPKASEWEYVNDIKETGHFEVQLI